MTRTKDFIAGAIIFAIAICGLAAIMHAQTQTAEPQIVVKSINANVQILSAATVKAKYGIKLPAGMSAGSVVAENATAGTIVVGQGTVLKALRDNNYPALSRADAASIILHSEQGGVFGFVKSNLPLVNTLLNDTEGLIVSRALSVTPGVGMIIAGVTAVSAKLTPDILARLGQFQETYDSDGLQSLLQLSPGQSAVGTVIFDTPGIGVTKPPSSFIVPVAVATVVP